jgi:integrase
MTVMSVQCEGRGPDDLVFGDGTNYLPRPKSASGWFAGAVKRAEVQKITPHDLRRSCASIAISSGGLFDTDLDAVALALDSKCAQCVSKRVASVVHLR